MNSTMLSDTEWRAHRILDRIERDGGVVHLSSIMEEIDTRRPLCASTGNVHGIPFAALRPEAFGEALR